MINIEKEIANLVEEIQDKAKTLLSMEYPNLYFYIGNDNDITIWVKRNGRDAEAILLPKYKSCLAGFRDSVFKELNDKLKPIAEEPDKYFYCTECGEVLPKEEYEDFVMAASYCKECAKKPDVAAAIKESHTRGFYD